MSLSTIEIQSEWGLFSGQALTISNIPIAFASAMSSAMISSIAALVAGKDLQGAKRKIEMATRVTMVISIPCAVGMFCLSKQITYLLFQDTKESLEIAGNLLGVLAPSVILYALSTLNSAILQGIDQTKKTICNAAVALFMQTICALVLLRITNLGIYSIAISNIVYSGIMSLLNQRATQKLIGYRQEIGRTFVIPMIASVIMGMAAYGSYQFFYFVIGSMRIATILSIVLAILVYGIAILCLKGVNEEELMQIPKGYKIVHLLKRLRLI